jgi:hypothetical protein
MRYEILPNYFVYNRFGRPKHIGLKALSKVLAMSLAWEETELPSFAPNMPEPTSPISTLTEA